jgi:hypothetical protein
VALVLFISGTTGEPKVERARLRAWLASEIGLATAITA